MSCPQCKTKIDNSWKFCADCKADLTVEQCLNNHDFGSNSVDDAILVPNEDDVNEYKRILQESGFEEFIEKITKENNKWKDVEINIAITGESGTGKSTLINALRNLKADDEGAAKIGCTETTITPTAYPYKDNGNVKIWDLPGVGTTNFPKETYLDTIKIERYDFILLVSCTRFMANDEWLAYQIKSRHPDGNLFFVRTKIDSDLKGYDEGHRNPLNEKEKRILLKTIEDEIIDNLRKAGITGMELFLINSNVPYTFDFGELVNKLVDKVNGLKRDAMILTLSAVTNEVVVKKIRILKKHLDAVALAGALTAKRSKHEKNSLDVLMREGKRYQQQLGIDSHSIEVLERVLRKDEIYQKLNMRSHAILKTPANFAAFQKLAKSRPPDRSSSLRRVFTQFLRVRVRKRQRKCAMVLTRLLDMCATETHTLHTNLALWLYE